MDTRSDIGFGYSMVKWIQSFWIGVVESVKKLQSAESAVKGKNMATFLTGRPGMSIRSKEGMAVTLVRLGRHPSSIGVKGTRSPQIVRLVRLGWLFRNSGSDSEEGRVVSNES